MEAKKTRRTNIKGENVENRICSLKLETSTGRKRGLFIP
jgi:hypothetical protein